MTPPCTPSPHTDTQLHTCTHSSIDIHFGFMPLFQCPRLHDILLPDNRPHVVSSQAPQHHPLPAGFSIQAGVPSWRQWLNLLPENGFGGTKMEEAFCRGNGVTTSWPQFLLLVTPTTAPPPPHTLTHLHSLMPQSQFLGHTPTPFVWGLCLPEFSLGPTLTS